MRLKNIVMKRKFIFNPFSKQGRRADTLEGIKEFFLHATGEFDCVVTQSRDHALQETRKALRSGVQQVVAIGGDGTVNAVVNGFFEDGKWVRSNSTLAVSNVGTGSDYFRGMVFGKNVTDWKKIVLEHMIQPVDIGHIHYASSSFVDQYFANMASFAMIADISEKKNKGPKWIPSQVQYLIPTIGSLISYKPQSVHLVMDSTVLDLKVLTIAIAKGRYAGSGMHFGGAVTLSDGYFDVTVIEDMPLLKMLMKLGKVYTDAFKTEGGIRKFKAKTVGIFCRTPLPVEYDGEVYGTTDVEISVAEHSVPVCMPKQ